jgi:two-component system, NarL family, response regulator YdfI
MPALKKERTHKPHPARIWVVASSSARRASLSALIAKNLHGGPADVVTSAELSPGRIVSAADIVVADLEGSGSSSALIRFMSEPASPAGFVAMIDDPDPRWVQAALKAGINAIISREPSGEELRLALEAADAGLVLLHPTTARGLLSSYVLPAEPGYDRERLTARESEVLRLLSEGLGNKEIASRLSISEHTAKFHISSILGKLSVATRTEAVSQGIRRGLIPI